MPTTQNCTYKSITLAVGEQFTLPPGAEIIAATDINYFTSTCTKPSSLDTFVCGRINWAIQPDNGGGTGPFSVAGGPDTYCTGIKVGDVDYLFASPVIGDDYVTVANSINALASLSGILTVYDKSAHSPTSERGAYAVDFNTLGSVFTQGVYLIFSAVDFTKVEILAQSITCP